MIIGFTQMCMGVIKDGVPQGSVLGPTHFFAISMIIISCDFGGDGPLCADDTVPFCKGQTLTELETTMNLGLRILGSCCVSNRLTINSWKTKCVIFDNPRGANLNVELNLQICGQPITGVNCYECLGVKLDNTLFFKSQIAKGSTSQRSGVLNIREHVAVLIYNVLIMSNLNYGGIFSLPATKKELEKQHLP